MRIITQIVKKRIRRAYRVEDCNAGLAWKLDYKGVDYELCN